MAENDTRIKFRALLLGRLQAFDSIAEVEAIYWVTKKVNNMRFHFAFIHFFPNAV